MNKSVKNHVDASLRHLEKALRIMGSQRVDPKKLKLLADARALMAGAASGGDFVLPKGKD